jgi:transcriptional regulator with XRE-family HTH domain
MATLRELRESNALSQRDLARLARVSVNTILDLEKSRRRPRPSTRRKLAKALKVLPRDIDFSSIRR